MKIVKRLIIFSVLIIIIILVGEFIASNRDDVTLKLFSDGFNLPLYLVVFSSFGLGFLLVTAVVLFELVRLELTKIDLKKKISKFEKNTQ